MVSRKSKRAPAKPDPTDAVTAPIEAPLPSVKDLLEAIQQLNKNQQVMEDNQKKLEQDNKQLAGYIAQLARTDSRPERAIQGEIVEPATGAQKLLGMARGLDLKAIFDLVGKFIPAPAPVPTTETGMIFNNKEMYEMYKEDFKDRMRINRVKMEADANSVVLDNLVKKKRLDGEMFD